ncbi:hypothetical protein JNX00_10900 [Hydrogenophaga sp. YM1]|uniref:hypothetical protein n=1 Tax=Hydrogenophaga sp. YM1 TaxID=2806262 RepID=UPI00195E3B70|nr:hypothetical protein [Hydrogenophaga sp. YM1]QRR36327.1 hypothetical protein JNX00_10900 [Hydrogenophaga sp. YM1]
MSNKLAKINVPLFIRNKRLRKATRRKHREWKLAQAGDRARARFNSAFGIRSKIAEMMAEMTDRDTQRHRGNIKFNLPPRFSLIDHPEQALAPLAKLAQAMQSRAIASVFVNFDSLEQYDLGANGLFDVLVEELAVESRRSGRTVNWRGNFPADPAHARFVRALGLIKRLKIKNHYPSPEDERRLELFDTRCRHYIRKIKPHLADQKSRVTAAFADHINRCLARIGRELMPESRSQLCAYVSEILDNAEQHSGMYDWSIQGYLDTQLSTPMCEVAIFNFGQSIAETFARLPADSFPRRQVQRYLDLHTRRSFFNAGWREEDLFTLIALQGNVSSKNVTEADTRGNGTVDLIDFFQRVHAECAASSEEGARMAIVSGSTYVLFDGKYEMRNNDRGMKIIAFNNDNSLEERPDRSYVRPLAGVMFPGTAIGIKFPLSTSKSTVATQGGQS